MTTHDRHQDVLDREFPELRAELLRLAAALDRIDRADGDAPADPRIDQIRRGIELLLSRREDRAEQIQLVFSRPYQENWQAEYGLRR